MHSAATGVIRPALETSDKHFDWTLSANARAFLSLARAAAPQMRPGSTIVAVSSLGSVRVLENYVLVGTSKAALEALVRYLAVELAPHGIRVNAVSGGVVDTDALDHFPNAEQMLNGSLERTPAGRLVEPGDIADAVVFLCSPGRGDDPRPGPRRRRRLLAGRLMWPTEQNRQAWDQRYGHPRSGARLPDAVRERLPDVSGKHVLHLACGTGEVSADLISLGALVTGVDPSEQALAVAREHVPDAAFFQADVQELPLLLKRSRFNVVYAGEGALALVRDLDPTRRDRRRAPQGRPRAAPRLASGRPLRRAGRAPLAGQLLLASRSGGSARSSAPSPAPGSRSRSSPSCRPPRPSSAAGSTRACRPTSSSTP